MTAAEHPLSPVELMEYLDGELSVERAAAVQAHLIECDGCQRLSGELRGVSRDLARWQVEDPPDTLTAPLAPLRTVTTVRSRFGWLFRPSIAYGLSAASIVGVVTVAMAVYGRVPQRSIVALAPADESGYTTALRGSAAPPKIAERSRLMTEPARPNAPAVAAAEESRITETHVAQRSASGPSIARTARLRVRTTDFDAARPVVDRVVADTGGLVGNVKVSGTRGDARSLTATLLIPASRLDAALATLKTVGLVLEESQGGDDVTEQVVDVESRLSNARNTEKRLVDLLQKRTGDLADVLAAEREIARVREEIERFDAQRKNLERRVTYATLNLEVTEEQHAALDLGPQPVSGRFRDAFVAGLTDALDSALGFGLFLVRVGPMLLLWSAILAWPVWAAARRSRRPNLQNP